MAPQMPPRKNALTLRKEDHLSMAQDSQTGESSRDARFIYEPMLAAHPKAPQALNFAGFKFKFPLWISSMTGGAAHARVLNANMARACAEFELGMGLGSCRPLLEDRQSRADFDVRDLMPGRPLFANLGIAQIEKLQAKKESDRVHALVDDLRADGLIIHVNPLQEWFQPEGDLLEVSPLETITRFVENAPYPVMVKEVGHGMGPESLKALMRLPLAAIEFGAYGGTNFSILESRRAPGAKPEGLVSVGHTAQEMVSFVKDILTTKEKFRCENFIISGGLQNSLQGYHLTSQLPGMALFGMANSVLREAQHGEVALREFLQKEISQYAMAQAYLQPVEGKK